MFDSRTDFQKYLSRFLRTCFGTFSVLNFGLLLGLFGCSTQPKRFDASEELRTLGSFEQRHSTDTYGRNVSYFINRKLGPTLIWIPGSGCSSLFRRDDKGGIRGGYQNILQAVAQDKATLLIVEKPGVELFDSPNRAGSAQDCSQQFLAEHTLERWGEAIRASVRAAAKLGLIDLSKGLMFVGHSEGAIVASYVSNLLPETTHLALLAGGGPTQLYDFFIFSQRRNTSESVEKRQKSEAEIWRVWDSIRKDPESTLRMAWGHPFKRWSSFMRTSPMEQLKKTKAKIIALHGTLDESTPIESFDILRSELLTTGANATFVKIEGADHAFNIPGEQAPEGMRRALQRVWQWYEESGSH